MQNIQNIWILRCFLACDVVSWLAGQILQNLPPVFTEVTWQRGFKQHPGYQNLLLQWTDTVGQPNSQPASQLITYTTYLYIYAGAALDLELQSWRLPGRKLNEILGDWTRHGAVAAGTYCPMPHFHNVDYNCPPKCPQHSLFQFKD